MEKLRVCVDKASPVGDQRIADTYIEIVNEIQDFMASGFSLADADRSYDSQAELICNALHNALPGGTFDRLLARMFLVKASHFRVSHASFKPFKPREEESHAE